MQPRRIVITGVNRGLGRALAERFVGAGHRVWGTSRSGEVPDGLDGSVELDLRDEASIVVAARQLRDQLDGVDLLINSAGTDARSFGAAEDGRGPFDLDAAAWNSVFEANVTGPMVIMRELLPLLRQGDSSMVVNVSSQLGSMQVGARMGRDTAYCASKAALNMLSLKAAAELQADGIGVVMLHPGWVATDMGGPHAQFSVDEAADAVASTIQRLTFADTGRFVRWDGHDHPW